MRKWQFSGAMTLVSVITLVILAMHVGVSSPAQVVGSFVVLLLVGGAGYVTGKAVDWYYGLGDRRAFLLKRRANDIAAYNRLNRVGPLQRDIYYVGDQGPYTDQTVPKGLLAGEVTTILRKNGLVRETFTAA